MREKWRGILHKLRDIAVNVATRRPSSLDYVTVYLTLYTICTFFFLLIHFFFLLSFDRSSFNLICALKDVRAVFFFYLPN